MIAIKATKLRKAAGPSKACAGMIIANGEIGISATMELCNKCWTEKEC